VETYPNQKIIQIRKQKYKDNFLQIGIDEWMEASKKLTSSAFKIYLYLSGNANGFNLALSKQAIEKDLGIKKTAYYDAMKELESLGYIHTIQGNIKEFTTTPYTAQFANTENGEEEQKRRSAKMEYFSEQTEAVSEKANGAVRKTNIEIDNIYKINKTNKIDKINKKRIEELEALIFADGSYKGSWFDEEIKDFYELSKETQIKKLTVHYPEFSNEDAAYIVNTILDY